MGILTKDRDFMIVRPLGEAERNAVEALDEMSGFGVSQWLEENEDYAWGLFDGETLAGYCTIGYADDCGRVIEEYPGYNSDSLLLSDVFVMPEYRRQGCGTLLVDIAIKNRTAYDREIVFLTVMRDELCSFYDKIGFSLVGNGVMVRDERSAKARGCELGETMNLLTKEYICAAVADCEDITVEYTDEKEMQVWDDQDAKLIRFRFLEGMGPEDLARLISISEDIPERYQVDKKVLAEYLWEACDRNAFITLEELVVIWSEPECAVAQCSVVSEGQHAQTPQNAASYADTAGRYHDQLSPLAITCFGDNGEVNGNGEFDLVEFEDSELARLCEEYGDEYALEIGQGVLGQLWFERNIAVVNMGEIVRAAEQVAKENEDLWDPWFSLENQVEMGFLTTVLHELRHLQMDTNIILPEEAYPVELASEENVEEYCRNAFENSVIPDGLFKGLYKDICIDEKIREASEKQKTVALDIKIFDKNCLDER